MDLHPSCPQLGGPHTGLLCSVISRSSHRRKSFRISLWQRESRLAAASSSQHRFSQFLMRLHYQVRKGSAGPPCSASARAFSNSGFLAKHTVQHSGGSSDRWLEAVTVGRQGQATVGRQGQRVCSLLQAGNAPGLPPGSQGDCQNIPGLSDTRSHLHHVQHSRAPRGAQAFCWAWGCQYERETRKHVRLAAGGPHARQTRWGAQLCTYKQTQGKAGRAAGCSVHDPIRASQTARNRCPVRSSWMLSKGIRHESSSTVLASDCLCTLQRVYIFPGLLR